jgi:hypothetical protein
VYAATKLIIESWTPREVRRIKLVVGRGASPLVTQARSASPVRRFSGPDINGAMPAVKTGWLAATTLSGDRRTYGRRTPAVWNGLKTAASMRPPSRTRIE